MIIIYRRKLALESSMKILLESWMKIKTCHFMAVNLNKHVDCGIVLSHCPPKVMGWPSDSVNIKKGQMAKG